MRFHTRLVSLAFAASAIGIVSCSGGGGGSTPSTPATSIPGTGSTEPIDQKIALTVSIPANATPIVTGRLRRGTTGRTRANASSQYLSAKTGSIVLTLALVDGQGFLVVPPAIAPIDPSKFCPSAVAGCTFTTPTDIPAAKGTDEYVVTTYSGPDGTGNVISTGFIDVTVPATSPAKLGAGTLTVGGYVASIALGSVSPPAFTAGTPSTLGLLLQAFDPAGAAIVGNATFAAPITVTIDDSSDFTIGGARSTLSVAGPITTPIPLAYDGGFSIRGEAILGASTTDENGATATAPPLVATISGTPKPTTPPNTGYSLYVDVTDTDTVEEFDAPNGTSVPVPAATPRRVLQLQTPPPSQVGSTFVCSPASSGYSLPSSGNGTYGVAVSKSGSIYVSPSCGDGTYDYAAFGFPASAHGPVEPTISDRYAPGPLNVFGLPGGGPLAIDASNDVLFSQPLAPGPGIFGFTPDVSNANQTSAIGYTCFQEIPVLAPYCSGTTSSNAFATQNLLFGAGAGLLFQPGYFDSATTGPGNYTPNAGGIALLPESDTQANGGVALPSSTIAGPSTGLFVGPQEAAATIDGNVLYVLNEDTSGQGLGGCPPPSSSATFGGPNMCADQFSHFYVTAYTIDASVAGAAVTNTNVDAKPLFSIGGDVVGKFGDTTGSIGQYIAAHDGFVYVLNPGATTNTNTFTTTYAPEIDVYDTRGLTGNHTDIAPTSRIAHYENFAHIPVAIAVGATGPASSVGPAVLRTARPIPNGRRHALRTMQRATYR